MSSHISAAPKSPSRIKGLIERTQSVHSRVVLLTD